MARYIGLLSSDARGKVGGLVMTRGVNGTNLKAHGVPINRNTPAQLRQRSNIFAGQFAWRQLTAFNQTTWATLAAQYTYLNSLAQPYSPTGLQLYLQAYSNAAYCGSVPPDSALAFKPSIQPIDDIDPENTGTDLTFTAYALGVPYGGSWLCQSSSVIPATVNYTKGTRRNFMGFAIAGSTITATSAWHRAYGDLPPSGMSISVRVVPFDATTFVSGSPALFTVDVD